MYGQVHVCVRSLVLEKFGDESWKQVLETSGCDPIEHFMTFERYNDTITLSLIGAVTEVLGVSLDAVLELFGDYFFIYCLEHGYDKMLRTLGDNIGTFIQNLDSLHALLSMTYKNIDAPSFRCEPLPDGNLILHYYSSRKGLYPIVIGLVRAVGRELYDQEVSMELLENSEEVLTEGRTVSHVVFKVTIFSKNACEGEPNVKEILQLTRNSNSTASMDSVIPSTPLISPIMFSNIFPFHVVFDKKLTVRQCGERISSIYHRAVWDNGELSLGDVFELIQPQMPLSFHHILRFCNATYILELKAASTRELTDTMGAVSKLQRLTLKGQMIWLEDIDHMLFIGSPRLSSLNDLEERNLYLSDIPLYDVTRELVLLNQQRLAELDVSKKLDETTAELKRTSQALETEKAKTDMLLYQMLPIKVANQLREGKKAEAEKFSQTTILFSDIVTFTNIAAAVQPMEVVGMLNELYSKFDHLTSVHGVYKVETIGDAYMVVGGIPDRTDNHATAVADFSLDMVIKAIEVLSPATGKPLQIRVGIHSGPVVAGVVGDKMPRYCLFGDTVNIASRMESHGLPGKIHISPFTYECLCKSDYIFEERGQIEVKGKGKMVTYFLTGSSGNVVTAQTSSKDVEAPKPADLVSTKVNGETPGTSSGDKKFSFFHFKPGKHSVDSASKLCALM